MTDGFDVEALEALAGQSHCADAGRMTAPDWSLDLPSAPDEERAVLGAMLLSAEEAGKIADGDLRGRSNIAARDEMGALGDSLNHMIENIRGVIGHVNDMTKHVAEASDQLTTSADQSAQASHMVAESIVSIAEGASEQAIEASNIQNTAEEADEQYHGDYRQHSDLD